MNTKVNEGKLISGKDALIALANGEDVEYLYGTEWESVTGNQILITAITGDKFKFRLKPRTIKIELEIPAPFEPKDGDRVWFICDDNDFGYAKSESYGDDIKSFYGWWRTEEEIKQVVAALRRNIRRQP